MNSAASHSYCQEAYMGSDLTWLKNKSFYWISAVVLKASTDSAEVIMPEGQSDGLVKKKPPLHQNYAPCYDSGCLVFNQKATLASEYFTVVNRAFQKPSLLH